MSVLSERALILCLSISKWSGQVTDADPLTAIGKKYKADTSRDRYIKNLFSGDALAEINLHAGRARNHFYHKTLPWLDGGGGRLIPGEMFYDFLKVHKEHKLGFDTGVDEFARNYEDLVEQAKESKGDLFVSSQYPSSETIRQKFEITLTSLPFPEQGDFRLDAPQEQLNELEDELKGTLVRINDTVSGDISVRLQDRLVKIRNNILEDKRFTKSHLDDLEFLRKLTDDLGTAPATSVRDAIADIQVGILKYTPEQIRNNEQLRATIVELCDKTIKDIS